MTGDEFMEAHGHQVLTALRSMIEFWQVQSDQAEDQAIIRLADDQVKSWQAIIYQAENVVD